MLDLRPANSGEIIEIVSLALRYQGGKQVHDADDTMARITADRLVWHLEQARFVLMRPPPGAAPAVGNVSAR